jgi:hypothetical protein
MNYLDVDFFKSDGFEDYKNYLFKEKKLLDNESDIYFEDDRFENCSLINDLEDKWDRIEKNKRLAKSGTKKSSHESKLFESRSKKSIFNYQINNNSRDHSYDHKVKSYKKKRRIENEDSGEFDEFIAHKIKQLELYKQDHILNNIHDSKHNLSKYSNAPLDVVKETNNVKADSTYDAKKTKSFLKKEEDIGIHKDYLTYKINSNIEEILTPSKTLLTKMQNIYGLVSNVDQNKKEEKEDDQYSLYNLEKNFEDIVSKINPNLKVKKIDIEPPKKTTDQRLFGLINESTRVLRSDTPKKHIRQLYKHDHVYSKNNFDKVNGKLSIVKCTKLKKLLDLNK